MVELNENPKLIKRKKILVKVYMVYEGRELVPDTFKSRIFPFNFNGKKRNSKYYHPTKCFKDHH